MIPLLNHRENSITLLHNVTQQHEAVILLLPKEEPEKQNE